jgi:hypothetical protein
MSKFLAEMVELFFIVYYIPKTMTRLAREQNKSALAWSFIGIGAWIAAELIVVLIFGAIYSFGMGLWGWPENLPGWLQLVVYVLALAAGGLALMMVERALDSKSRVKTYPVPPPPPKF